MKYFFFLILALFILITSVLKSAEIVPVWNRTIEGKVSDMEFLKGQNEILMLVGEGSNGQIQRRNPENGELLHSFPYPLSTGSKFVLTPDSLRFVLLNGNGGLIRNIDDQYTISSFFDIEYEDTIGIKYSIIAMDPIRPHVYVATSSWFKKTNFPASRNKVIAYNYETGEHIKDLTEYGEDEYTAIEVSHDGKYLAILNDNKAYLKVWDLETMEQIINEPLFDENSKTRCESRDIYFSNIDDNVIYISGFFSKQIDNKRKNGIFRFNIEKRIRERVISEGLYDGYNVVALDSESLIFNSSSQSIAVLNLLTDNLDWYGFPPKNVYSETIIYNESMNYFIGASSNELSKFLYDRETSIVSEYEEEIIISPNPTNGSINISFTNKHSSSFQYELISNSGQIVQTAAMGYLQLAANSINLDISSIANGNYILRVFSLQEEFVFNVIKEG